MSDLQLPNVFTLIDDQTQRFWTWLLLSERLNLKPAILLRFEELSLVKSIILNEIHGVKSKSSPVVGILIRCLFQIEILQTWANDPFQLDRLRHISAQLPDVGKFDSALKTFLRHKWYDVSLEELVSLRDKLKSFLLLQGTLPAIPKDTFDYSHECWDCRFSRAVSFTDADSDDEEEEVENSQKRKTNEGCNHLLFFLQQYIHRNDTGELSYYDDDNDNDGEPGNEEQNQEINFQTINRVDWQLEIRRKQRLHKTRQMVLLQIEREKMKHQRLIERILCPKQVNLVCFQHFGEFDDRLETSLYTSSYFEEKGKYIMFNEGELKEFRRRLKSVIAWDCDTHTLHDLALDKWRGLVFNLDKKYTFGSEATLRGVLVAEGENSLFIQHYLDFLKSRSLLCVLEDGDEKDEKRSPIVDLFDSILYITCMEMFLGIKFPIISEIDFNVDKVLNTDIIVLYHRLRKTNNEDSRPRADLSHRDLYLPSCIANHLSFGAQRKGSLDILLFRDVVSLSLFWLRTTKNIFNNNILDFVVGAVEVCSN